MKQIKYIALALLSLILSSCHDDIDNINNIPQAENQQHYSPIRINITASTQQTKTTIDSDYNSLWCQEDIIGIFSPEAYYEWQLFGSGDFKYTNPASNIAFALQNGANSVFADFCISATHNDDVKTYTGNFAWNTQKEIHNFYAYHPYSEAAKAATKHTHVPFTLPGAQKQDKADNADFMGQFDLMYATKTFNTHPLVTDKEQADVTLDFQFRHLLSWVEYTVINSTSTPITLSKLTLESGDYILAGDFTLNLENGTLTGAQTIDPMGNPITGSRFNRIETELLESATLAIGDSCKVYMMINPCNLTTDDNTITVETTSGIQQYPANVNLESGKRYTKRIELTKTENPFTLYTITFDDFDTDFLAGPSSYGENLYDGTYYEIYDAKNWLRFGLNTYYGENDFYNGGFAISQWNDTITPDYINQCSVFSKDHITGKGGFQGSSTFAIGQGSTNTYGGKEAELYFMEHATLSQEAVIDHAYFTNTTYAALSMLHGDSYVGSPYTLNDWMRWVVTGYDINGNETGKVTFYLADFRTSQSEGVVTHWKRVSLSSLGKVNKITFTPESTRKNAYGILTPTYFAMDNLTVRME
ncbi:MAG: DUF4465 domain-containing protein [Marinifilaceae bacterium]